MKFRDTLSKSRIALMMAVCLLYENYAEDTKRVFSLEQLEQIVANTRPHLNKRVEEVFCEVLFGE